MKIVQAFNQETREGERFAGGVQRALFGIASGAQERLIHVALQTHMQAQVTAGLSQGERILLKRQQRSDVQESAGQRGNTTRFRRGPQL